MLNRLQSGHAEMTNLRVIGEIRARGQASVEWRPPGGQEFGCSLAAFGYPATPRSAATATAARAAVAETLRDTASAWQAQVAAERGNG